MMALAFSHNGFGDGESALVAGNKDGKLFWFTFKEKNFNSTVKLTLALKGHEKTIRDIQFSKNDEYLLTCGDDMLIKLYDSKSRSLVNSFLGHNSWVMSVDMFLNNDVFISTSVDRTLKVFEIKTSKLLGNFNEYDDEVTEARVNKKGKIYFLTLTFYR